MDKFEQEIKQNLKNWQAIIRQYHKPNTGKAVIQILNSFLPFLGLWTLMYFSLDWHYGITIALAMVNAFFVVRIFIIQHDCGHGSFLKSKGWNYWIGFVCSFITTIPYTYWAKVHSFHHGHSGQLELRDIGDLPFLTTDEYRALPRWRRWGYMIFRTPLVLFVFAPIIYLLFSNRVPLINFKGWRKTHVQQFFNNIFMVLFYVGLIWLFGWKAILLIQIPLVLGFGIIAFWFFYVQHQHEETYKNWKKDWDYLIASIRGSTYYKLPKLFHWLTGNIGFHHIHHLSPRIPNYELEKCARENPILQKYVTSLTFVQSLKCSSAKLWDEQQRRMISFREYYQLEKARR
ncbi:MAG: fatty acid desaturase, partial [Bacteroidota bacterium]